MAREFGARRHSGEGTFLVSGSGPHGREAICREGPNRSPLPSSLLARFVRSEVGRHHPLLRLAQGQAARLGEGDQVVHLR